mmetsp:Transcript_48606/g.99237  ORF Transcript_48606/g.99237 Transcript_48606/m.99237 type:complete len:290 (+) Transcript_48606:112-981(+)|eukprot:CAMPEP_0181322834 /NCGR_PEP_ID=MMETSP1101-20121128/19446_1 /TAXON_ID=46948 /ORGANISM="Rhodomonas abbreviata, Strain Caron Lab Isolate" /LENGTH=289 /DNA_ID=CAMNT_0023430787 /DNA_START=109 /DNA_END=978 /DNA_ORIENTATION=+
MQKHDRDDANDEEGAPPAKKQATGEPPSGATKEPESQTLPGKADDTKAPEAAVDQPGDDGKVADTETAKSSSKLDESGDAPVCAVCMEADGENDRVLLPAHNCPTCKPDAWKICDGCNEALLSRVCPMCRSKYAPQILHRWPSKTELQGANLPEAPCGTMLKKLIASSNVAVWSPTGELLKFSLPRDPTLPAHRREYVQATLKVSQDRVADGTFLFDNDVWEELCGEDVDEAPEGDRPSGAADLLVRRATDGMAWVNTAMQEEGSCVMTQMEAPLEMLRELASEVQTAL